MAEPLTKTELAQLRGFTNRVGAAAAARALDIHVHSLTGALSGEKDLRPNTIKAVRAKLADGIIDNDPPPASLREHNHGRAQASAPKVRA